MGLLQVTPTPLYYLNVGLTNPLLRRTMPIDIFLHFFDVDLHSGELLTRVHLTAFHRSAPHRWPR